MIEINVKNNTAAELYDIIDHCRTDTIENFVEDLKAQLKDEAKFKQNEHAKRGGYAGYD